MARIYSACDRGAMASAERNSRRGAALRGAWRKRARATSIASGRLLPRRASAMMVTRFAGGLRARPLEARHERDTETIWFLTDVRIEANPNVCLTFVYAKEKVYL